MNGSRNLPLLGIVELAYSMVEVQAGVDDLFVALRRLIPFSSGVLIPIDPATLELRRGKCFDCCPADMQGYLEHYAPMDPFVVRRPGPSLFNRTVLLSEVASHNELDRSEYAAFMHSVPYACAAGVLTAIAGQPVAAFCVHRTRTESDFTADERAIIDGLAPASGLRLDAAALDQRSVTADANRGGGFPERAGSLCQSGSGRLPRPHPARVAADRSAPRRQRNHSLGSPKFPRDARSMDGKQPVAKLSARRRRIFLGQHSVSRVVRFLAVLPRSTVERGRDDRCPAAFPAADGLCRAPPTLWSFATPADGRRRRSRRAVQRGNRDRNVHQRTNGQGPPLRHLPHPRRTQSGTGDRKADRDAPTAPSAQSSSREGDARRTGRSRRLMRGDQAASRVLAEASGGAVSSPASIVSTSAGADESRSKASGCVSQS